MNLTDKYLKVNEAPLTGKTKETMQLVNVLVGWPKDIQKMIGYENYTEALKSLKVFKTKVIPDLEKSIKELMKK